MSEPSQGFVVLAELVNPTEGDLAVAALQASGIHASLQSDPRKQFYGSVARSPLRSDGHVLEVVVPAEDEAQARQVLDEMGDDLPPEFHDDSIAEWSAGIEERDRRRKARGRRFGLTVLVILLVAVIVALLIGAVMSLVG